MHSCAYKRLLDVSVLALVSWHPCRAQVEMQKMENKLKSAVQALQQEQISSEKTHKRDALEIHRLEEQIQVPFLQSIY